MVVQVDGKLRDRIEVGLPRSPTMRRSRSALRLERRSSSCSAGALPVRTRDSRPETRQLLVAQQLNSSTASRPSIDSHPASVLDLEQRRQLQIGDGKARISRAIVLVRDRVIAFIRAALAAIHPVRANPRARHRSSARRRGPTRCAGRSTGAAFRTDRQSPMRRPRNGRREVEAIEHRIRSLASPIPARARCARSHGASKNCDRSERTGQQDSASALIAATTPLTTCSATSVRHG